MSATTLLFAAGPQGLNLTLPPGVSLLPGTINIEPGTASESEQRVLIENALSTGKLRQFAEGKRRAIVLVGDLALPAPYDIVLPAVVKELIEAGIRPSRIAVLASPGGCGTLLGRAAIHRYGEELCGEHEVNPWLGSEADKTLLESADLRIAIAPKFCDLPFEYVLPPGIASDYSIELKLSRLNQISLVEARGCIQSDKKVPNQTASETSADVLITSGGGSPWEETLEEALLSLHKPGAQAKTAVLIYSGSEGLGLSRFTLDFWTLIKQAQEVLAAGGKLGKPAIASAQARFDPAGVLAQCLLRYQQTILFSADFLEHNDADELLERLDAAPDVAKQLNLCRSQTELWQMLSVLHGERYTIHAEPLGWRTRLQV